MLNAARIEYEGGIPCCRQDTGPELQLKLTGLLANAARQKTMVDGVAYNRKDLMLYNRVFNGAGGCYRCATPETLEHAIVMTPWLQWASFPGAPRHTIIYTGTLPAEGVLGVRELRDDDHVLARLVGHNGHGHLYQCDVVKNLGEKDVLTQEALLVIDTSERTQPFVRDILPGEALFTTRVVSATYLPAVIDGRYAQKLGLEHVRIVF